MSYTIEELRSIDSEIATDKFIDNHVMYFDDIIELGRFSQIPQCPCVDSQEDEWITIVKISNRYGTLYKEMHV